MNIRKTLDIAAGYQLANYNQWYHQYDIEHKLSERMASKDVKKNAKRLPRGAIKRSNADMKDERRDTPLLLSSPSRQITRNRVRNKATRARLLQTVTGDDSDADYPPVPALR